MIFEDEIIKILQSFSLWEIGHFHYKDVAKAIINKLKERENNFWENRGIHQNKDGVYPTEEQYQAQIKRCERLKELDSEEQKSEFDYLIRLCDEFENKYC